MKSLLHNRLLHIILISGMMFTIVMPSFNYCGSFMSACPMQKQSASSCCPSEKTKSETNDIPILIDETHPKDCQHSAVMDTNECTLCNCTISPSAIENSFVFTIAPQVDTTFFPSYIETISFSSAPPNYFATSVSAVEIPYHIPSAPIFIQFCSYLI